MKRATIDFETQAIENRPAYPPKPVGVAIRERSRSRYLAWGHPEGNNTTKREAVRVLKDLWKTCELTFHNGAFDMDVARAHMGLPLPTHWDDTLLLSYLFDPRDASLSLKPLAAKYLNQPPEEQDLLREWILENVSEATQKTWGAYIARAPAQIVRPYAIGDVDRTSALFDLRMPQIRASSMLEAYEREKKIIPIKLRMEERGIRCDMKRLKKDIKVFYKLHQKIERAIFKSLGMGTFNLNSSVQLAEALAKSGKVDTFVLTEKGNVSTKRENLEATCKDKKLVDMLGIHGILATYLSTFLGRWVQSDNGWIYPSFNTVRSADEYGGKGLGTRTGRLSSSNPNFQNIPADVEGAKQEYLLKLIQKELRKLGVDFVGMRDYLIPDEGCVFIGRDYSQQELRILAHFEDDRLMRMYLENPRIDIHETIRVLMSDELRVELVRKAVKIVVFAIIYGRGDKNLAIQLDTDIETARRIRNALFNIVPGIKDLNRQLKNMARRDEPLRTWGGRLYLCEPPKYINGEKRNFAYKQLNLLIQGSAADCTKEGMINVEQNWQSPDSRIVLQVHDELLACVPRGMRTSEMARMKEGMEAVKFDVPMLSDGKWSAKSWGQMKGCE